MTTNQPSLMSADPSRALADPLRAQIVELLSGEQMCTCHLVEATGASQSNISNHLRVLRNAGLVVDEPIGRYTYHRVMAEPLFAMADRYRVLAERAQHAEGVQRPCN
jgi:ArsR family transcriptional regulator